MKKKELLYRAVGGLDDKTVNDAIEYKAEKRDHSRLFAVLEGAAIVAVVCGLVALSLVLMKIAGPKTDPAASGEEITTAEETNMESEMIPDCKDPSAVSPDTEELKIDELVQMEPYKDFIPETIPNLFSNFHAYRIVPGEYEQNDGNFRYVDEEWYLYIGAPDHNGVDTNWLDITIKKLDDSEAENVIDADKLSVPLIESSRKIYSDPYGNRTWKLMLTYNVAYKAEGYEVIYKYTKLSGEVNDKSSPVYPDAADYAALDAESQLSPEYLFEMITSAPYFKDHPVSKDAETVSGITFGSDEITLAIEFNSDRYDFFSVIELTATLKNHSDHDITIVVPVTAPEHNSHTEIQISIYRADNETVRLKDMDTYGVYYETAESYLTLKPGEEYVQKMRLTGDIEAFESVPQGAAEQNGVYTGIAKVKFADGESNPGGELVVGFELNIG
ncbi:MAG: hypothetical protein J5585_02295 [Clostridia bacterium]|nr:hypothetical protein [Clostridia bacterium]